MLGVHVAVARDPYPNEDEAGDSGQNARRNTFITGRTGSTSSTACGRRSRHDHDGHKVQIKDAEAVGDQRNVAMRRDGADQCIAPEIATDHERQPEHEALLREACAIRAATGSTKLTLALALFVRSEIPQ
jgi:hypothetical protein